MAKHVCLLDILDAIQLSYPLFAATVAVTAKTDWGAGTPGIGLSNAFRAVHSELRTIGRVDESTLSKKHLDAPDVQDIDTCYTLQCKSANVDLICWHAGWAWVWSWAWVN